MKIWGDSFEIQKVYNKQKGVNRVGSTQAPAAKKDVLSISDGAKDFATVSKALRGVSDMRQDKVNEFTDLYNSGNYNVNGKQIVDKLASSILDKKA